MVIDRQIRGIQREEDKVKKELKAAAKRGDRDVCLVFAKEIVNARKAITRLTTSKAHINSIMLNMNHQIATLKVTQSLERSTDVMRSMSNLIKIQEIAGTMQEMSREMMRAGIIDEMLEETMEDALGGEELEMEADKEVDKVLFELTDGQLGQAPEAPADSLPSVSAPASKSKNKEQEPEIDEMQERLKALQTS